MRASFFLLLFLFSCNTSNDEVHPLDRIIRMFIDSKEFGEILLQWDGPMGYNYEIDYGDGTTTVGDFKSSNSQSELHTFRENGEFDIKLILKKGETNIDTLANRIEINDAFVMPHYEIKQERLSENQYKLSLISDEPTLKINWSLSNGIYGSTQKEVMVNLPLEDNYNLYYRVTYPLKGSRNSVVNMYDSGQSVLESTKTETNYPMEFSEEISGLFLGDTIKSSGVNTVKYNGACCDGAPIGMPIYEYKADNGILIRLLGTKFSPEYTSEERYEIMKEALQVGFIELENFDSDKHLGLSIESPANHWLLPVVYGTLSKSIEVLEVEEVNQLQVFSSMYSKALLAKMRLKVAFKELEPIDVYLNLRFYTY